MDKYLLFEAFERGDYIPQEFIKKVTNYICGQLISWPPNRANYEAQYNYATKLQVVYRWKQKLGLPALARKREAICDDQLVSFFKDKEHKKLKLFNSLNILNILFYKSYKGNDIRHIFILNYIL